jgi:indole-3-glycerol phosphate synthase
MSEEQVWEARGAGADALLLIVRILDDGRLEGLRALAEGLGMVALVEAHDGAELRRGLRSGARLIGINNRNLATFRTSLETTLDLLPTVPEGVTLVSESGIGTREEVERLGAAGVDAILVGEALLRAPDPGAKARHLSGVERTSDPRMRARGRGAT